MEHNFLSIELPKKNDLEEITDIEKKLLNFENSLKYWQNTSKIQNLINELKKMIEIQNNSKNLEVELLKIIDFVKNKRDREEEIESKW